MSENCKAEAKGWTSIEVSELTRLRSDNERLQKELKEKDEAIKEMAESDAEWRIKATESFSNGTCPVCFCTDEGPHEKGCEWHEMEYRISILGKSSELNASIAVSAIDRAADKESVIVAAESRARNVEAALCRAREALEKIADYDWVKGGRILFGNEEIPGDTGQFYRGYNAGIRGQFEATKVIAKAVLSSSAPCPHAAIVAELEARLRDWERSSAESGTVLIQSQRYNELLAVEARVGDVSKMRLLIKQTVEFWPDDAMKVAYALRDHLKGGGG